MDLAHGPDGDLVIAKQDFAMVDGAEAVRQAAECYCRTLLGEWFLDESIGLVDLGDKSIWFSVVPNIGACKAETRRILFTVPGVTSVANIDIAIDRSGPAPELQVTAAVNGTSGPLDLTISVPL